jgi:hypothetical protein
MRKRELTLKSKIQHTKGDLVRRMRQARREAEIEREMTELARKLEDAYERLPKPRPSQEAVFTTMLHIYPSPSWDCDPDHMVKISAQYAVEPKAEEAKP